MRLRVAEMRRSSEHWKAPGLSSGSLLWSAQRDSQLRPNAVIHGFPAKLTFIPYWGHRHIVALQLRSLGLSRYS